MGSLNHRRYQVFSAGYHRLPGLAWYLCDGNQPFG